MSYHVESVRNALQQQGWCRIDLDETEENSIGASIQNIAAELGELLRGRGNKTMERIVPLTIAKARSSSLSEKFGLSDFPFHNDTAHWPVPCRYVVIACVNPGLENVPTFFLDTHSMAFTDRESALMKRGVFFIRTGRRSFYSSIRSDQRPFLRFDPGCMEPMDEDAVEATLIFSLLRASRHAQQIEWQTGTVAVFDNWRVLHRRGSISPQSQRALLRCSVK